MNKQEKISKQEFTVKHFDNFTLYSLDTFYVISYFSSYGASCRQKTYKTRRAAYKVWDDIVSGKITYVEF